jgi:2-keto-4-pentenoate hydratase/2-oxohepta-3-ene-1,7-dioic acid hydratase in catechol pathway
MKLVVFNSKRLGALLEDGSVVDLNSAYSALLARRGVNRPHAHACSTVPPNILAFIEEGEAGLRAAEEAISFAREGAHEDPGGGRLVLKPEEVRLMAPLPSLASRIAMAGANFYDHAAKAYSMIRGVKVTEEDIRKDVEDGRSSPWGFWKSPRNVIGPGEPIIYPGRTERLDYEVEVAAIFGRRGKDIPEEAAMEHIYGYTIVNDVSARDQPGDNGFFLAKNFDTSTPMGPCIVTADELGDPHGLRLRLKVNGETRQDGSQEDMIRGYPFWTSFLSRDMTFYPGDIICGGTCAGTALDTSPRDSEGRTEPDRFMKAGDVVEAWVEKIGTLRNPVTAKG